MTRRADQIVLEVNDDGVRIDSSDTSRAVQAGHVGLATVRRRVEDSDGRFEIETRADGGTPGRAWWCRSAAPLDDAAADGRKQGGAAEPP